MNKVNIALVRLLQFVVFALFTFMVLVYVGAMVLVPLDLVLLIINILGIAGVDGMIATMIAVPIVGYLGLMVYKTPGLVKIIVDTGLSLVNSGKERIEAFNEIAESVKA